MQPVSAAFKHLKLISECNHSSAWTFHTNIEIRMEWGYILALDVSLNCWIQPVCLEWAVIECKAVQALIQC
jgi:hypothetical protein